MRPSRVEILASSDLSLSGRRQIPEDGEADVKAYNDELAALATAKKDTWFTAPWLYAEYVRPLSPPFAH